MCLSDPQTAVASTRMRTSAWPGDGTGRTSRTSVAAGPGPGFRLDDGGHSGREAGCGMRDAGCGMRMRDETFLSFRLFTCLSASRSHISHRASYPVQSPAWSSRTNPPRVPAASASACTETGLTYFATSVARSRDAELVEEEARTSSRACRGSRRASPRAGSRPVPCTDRSPSCASCRGTGPGSRRACARPAAFSSSQRSISRFRG